MVEKGNDNDSFESVARELGCDTYDNALDKAFDKLEPKIEKKPEQGEEEKPA